jgi:acetolactate decarboxylase
MSTDSGAVTIGALLEKGDHGIGTVEHLDGEMMIVDGVAYAAFADGSVRAVPDETITQFAVVCRFSVLAHSPVRRPLGLRSLRDVLDEMVPTGPGVVAVRLDGDFTDLRLRGVHAQTQTAPPLAESTASAAHQTEWSGPTASGTVVGFRLSDRAAGGDEMGYHLHFLSDDRTHGGHVLDLSMAGGGLLLGGCDELGG